STSKSNKIDLIKCTICHKQLGIDDYYIHLQNVHRFNFNESMDKDQADLSDSNNKNQTNKKITTQPKPITERDTITESDYESHYFIADDIIFKNHQVEIISRKTGLRFNALDSKSA